MAKKAGRPRKVFVDDREGMLSLVALIADSKAAKVQAKVEHKKDVLSHTAKEAPKPRPRDLKLKEAKALAAARLRQKKRGKKETARVEDGGAAAATSGGDGEGKQKEGRKKVSFG